MRMESLVVNSWNPPRAPWRGVQWRVTSPHCKKKPKSPSQNSFTPMVRDPLLTNYPLIVPRISLTGGGRYPFPYPTTNTYHFITINPTHSEPIRIFSIHIIILKTKTWKTKNLWTWWHLRIWDNWKFKGSQRKSSKRYDNTTTSVIFITPSHTTSHTPDNTFSIHPLDWCECSQNRFGTTSSSGRICE